MAILFLFSASIPWCRQGVDGSALLVFACKGDLFITSACVILFAAGWLFSMRSAIRGWRVQAWLPSFAWLGLAWSVKSNPEGLEGMVQDNSTPVEQHACTSRFCSKEEKKWSILLLEDGRLYCGDASDHPTP